MLAETVLFPCDYFSPRQPDEHFADEALAAQALGLQVATLADQVLITDGRLQTVRLPESGTVIYRGWMLRAEQYQLLADQLSERGLTLVTSPSAYQAAHELPGWYQHFTELTPKSAWTTSTDDTAVSALLTQFAGPVVIKDYVKSAKDQWNQACFIPEAADRSHALQVVHRFLELRERDLTGGLVVRSYEQFVKPEVRTWWVNGEHRLTSAHPDNPNDPILAPPIEQFSAAVQALSSPFITLDLVQDQLGRWRVIEVGDGQVSDRPRSVEADTFLTAIIGS